MLSTDESRGFNNFNPFFICQNRHYARAVRELTSGRRKTENWTGFVFPRLVPDDGGKKAHYFGLKTVTEARNYLNNPILATRLVDACNVALASLETNALSVVQLMKTEAEALKLLSCVTLFEHVSTGKIYQSTFTQLKFVCTEQLGAVDEYTEEKCRQKSLVIETRETDEDWWGK